MFLKKIFTRKKKPQGILGHIKAMALRDTVPGVNAAIFPYLPKRLSLMGSLENYFSRDHNVLFLQVVIASIFIESSVCSRLIQSSPEYYEVSTKSPLFHR